MTRTELLLEACDHGDEHALEQLGWRGVIDALRMWPRRIAGGDLAPYAIALGETDPLLIVSAIRALATNEYRPSAAQVLVALRPPDPQPLRRADARADLAAAALQSVRLRAAAGAEICDCIPRSPQMNIDPDGVLTCPWCSGLEPGQLDTALESPE